MADLEQLNNLLRDMQQQYAETAGTTWRVIDQRHDDGWWIEGTKTDGGIVWLTSPTRDGARALAAQMNVDGYGMIDKTKLNEFMHELLTDECAITLSPTHGLKEIARVY